MTALLLVSCDKPQESAAPSAQSYARFVPDAGTVEDLALYRSHHIGGPVGDMPWVAHVRTVDLDQDGRMDVIACEAKHHVVLWLHQTAPGVFEEKVLVEDMRAPVHVEAEDMDGDGDLDILVSSMSFVFPNNDKIGAIFILENDGAQTFHPHLIIENIDRVTDVRAADFDGDGRLDLAVGQLGYDQGEVRWMRRTGPWTFESEILLRLSGTVNVGVADFDGNGTLDMVALVSQQWEEIHLFENVGRRNYRKRVICGSTNEDYSLSGMSLAEVNLDGRMDILFTNGDGFGPNAEPGPKPWHGVQYLENAGYGQLEPSLPLWEKVLELAPRYLPAHVRRADALLKLNRHEEAQAAYREIQRIEPTNPYAFVGLARVAMAGGDYATARAALLEAAGNSGNRIGADLLVTVFEELGEDEKAICLRRVAKASGTFTDIPDPWVNELTEAFQKTFQTP